MVCPAALPTAMGGRVSNYSYLFFVRVCLVHAQVMHGRAASQLSFPGWGVFGFVVKS